MDDVFDMNSFDDAIKNPTSMSPRIEVTAKGEKLLDSKRNTLRFQLGKTDRQNDMDLRVT